MFNPGEQSARVVVQVTPFGGAELPPEPFEVEVPARRYSVLDLSAETRIPAEGFHTIQVRVRRRHRRWWSAAWSRSPGHARTRPRGDHRPPTHEPGTAIGTGTPVGSTLWAATGLVVGGPQESTVFDPQSDVGQRDGDGDGHRRGG